MMRCGRDWESHPDDLPPMTDSELMGGARIMMVLMVAFFSYWLVSDIRSDRSWLPEYPKLQIQSASVSGLSQHVTWWNITLLTTNPNPNRNLTVKYESIEPSVYYGDKSDYDKNPRWFQRRQIVATKKLERSPFPFFLEKGGNSTSLINFTPVAVLSEDVDHDLATKIKEELALRRSVKFGLWIMLSFTLTAEMPGKYHNGPLSVSYFCNQVEFVFAPIDDRTGIFTGEELNLELADDGDAQIAKRLAIVGLWCIQWYPVNRPSMKAVVRMLEGPYESLIMPPNPFASATHQMEPTAPDQVN